MASFNFGERISGRSVVGDTLHAMGKVHENLFVLTADTGMALKSFRDDFRPRYIDVGIAEQTMVGIAAGLALEENIPFIMNMIPFMTMRACEQIRTAVCYQNLPVRFVGTGGGLTSGGGSTHNAMEDISLMRSLVNMTVLSIGDPNMIRNILELSWDYPGPMFIRLAQGKADRVIYEPVAMQYEIGKATLARKGSDVTVFAHGEMVFEALTAAGELAKEDIDVRVVDMFTIKPIDEEAIVQAAEQTYGIVVVEDHLMFGGLASAIADILADKGISVPFRRLGIPQVYAGFGSGEELRTKYGYDTHAVIAAVKDICGLGAK